MKGVKFSSKVVPFLQSASYYLQKGNQYYQQNKLKKALLFFKKTIEVEPENSLHHYNLACLLSRMGYLEKANQIFSYIVYRLDPSLTECYFLMAVNYGLLDDLEKARYYLKLYLQFSPNGEMALDAEELLFVLNEETMEYPLEEHPWEEHHNLPGASKERERGKDKETMEIVYDYRRSQEVRNALWRALYHENEELVEKAIHIFGILGEDSGEKALREFVKNPWINHRLRIQAMLKLKNMGVRGVVPVFLDEIFQEVNLSYYPLLAPRWLEQWQDVLDCTLKNMRLSACYDEHFYEDAQAIWIDYINNIYPRSPHIKKIETWAAALEYALGRFHFLKVTQKELAQQYGISPSSISAKYREINKVLNLEQKAYHNMLRYFSQREKD